MKRRAATAVRWGLPVADAALARSRDLLGLGECMVELLGHGPIGQVNSLRRGYGGDVLNALVAAARLGGRCGFISRVGKDPFGPALREAWQQEGIDLQHAPLVPGDNGVYFISVNAQGEREFSYRRDGSPASMLSAEALDAGYLADSHMLLLSGISQALSPSVRAATLAAAQMARQHGVLVAFDPNYRPRLWQAHGGLAAAQQALQDIAPWVDWLLPSHPADTLLVDASAAAAADDDLSAAADAIEAFGALAPQVALKLGPQGCLLRTPGARQHVEGVAARLVLDTTGAGDLWNGSFLMSLREGQLPPQAALRAHRLAARKLAFRGAIPPLELYAGERASA